MHVLGCCVATGVDRVHAGIGFNRGDYRMRNLILVGALALLVLSPLTAAAQQRAAPAPVAPAPTNEGISSSKILAIGAGAILGVVAAQAIVAGEGLTLVGGVAGGVLAAWWYDNSGGG